jgi:hypothetical protein
VLGDWRGSQPSLDPYHSRTVELILDGTPDSVSGTYHLLTLVMTPDLGGQDNQNLRWTDRWEKRVLTDGTGARIITIHLHHAPDTQLSDYLLSSNGLLVPLIHPEHPDLSPEAMRIALVPLPRTAWGYGRP